MNVTWLFSETGSVPAAAAAPDPACSLVLDWVVVEGPASTKVLKSRRIWNGEGNSHAIMESD